jgi:hypothetical protein
MFMRTEAHALALLPGALLAAWGFWTGGPPPGLRTSTHLEWTVTLLAAGLVSFAIVGLIHRSRWIPCLSLMICGMMLLYACPRPLDPDPLLPPLYPRLYVGFPVRHSTQGPSPVGFPYLAVFHPLGLLSDLAIGGAAGFLAGWIATRLRGPATSPPA